MGVERERALVYRNCIWIDRHQARTHVSIQKIHLDRQASSEIESETRGNLAPTGFVTFSASTKNVNKRGLKLLGQLCNIALTKRSVVSIDQRRTGRILPKGMQFRSASVAPDEFGQKE